MSVSTFDQIQILQVDADATQHLQRYLRNSPQCDRRAYRCARQRLFGLCVCARTD